MGTGLQGLFSLIWQISSDLLVCRLLITLVVTGLPGGALHTCASRVPQCWLSVLVAKHRLPCCYSTSVKLLAGQPDRHVHQMATCTLCWVACISGL